MSTKKSFFRSKTIRTLALALFVASIAVQLLPLLQVSAQTSVETEFMAILNAERASLGKSPLTINTYLSTAAYLHSKDMAENGYFSHTSLDGRTFVQRIVAAGYTNFYALGENIAYAYGAPSASKVYIMWKNSPGHYANMMGDYNDAGLGVYSKNGYTYYTLDLGKSRSPTAKTMRIAVTTDTSTYSRGASGTLRVTVTDSASGTGLQGASVFVKVNLPDGTIAQTTRATDASGKLRIYFTLSSNAPLGTYVITATASKTGYSTASGQTTLKVV